MIDMKLAKAKGFDFGTATKFFDSKEPHKGVTDALDPNTTVPAYMNMYANPRVIEVLTAKRNYRAIAPEVKNGDWTTAFTQFRSLEFTGETTPYQDYDANGQANVNTNFPTANSTVFRQLLELAIWNRI